MILRHFSSFNSFCVIFRGLLTFCQTPYPGDNTKPPYKGFCRLELPGGRQKNPGPCELQKFPAKQRAYERILVGGKRACFQMLSSCSNWSPFPELTTPINASLCRELLQFTWAWVFLPSPLAAEAFNRWSRPSPLVHCWRLCVTWRHFESFCVIFASFCRKIWHIFLPNTVASLCVTLRHFASLCVIFSWWGGSMDSLLLATPKDPSGV